MVSAPDTSWTSVHWRPASASAACAACTPYSTKLRPHLPQGCMPTPRTATSPTVISPSLARCARSVRASPVVPACGRRSGCRPAEPDRQPFLRGAAPPGPPRWVRRSYRAPLPHDRLLLVVLEQGVEDELDLGPHRE